MTVRILFALSAILVCVCLPAAVAAQPVFRATVDLVNIGVTVVDRKGALVTNLGPDDFEVLDEGHKQKIDYFLRGDEHGAARPPMRIGLLFDTSGSMQEDLRFSRTAAIKFLNTLDW